jgi:hypothetical protein
MNGAFLERECCGAAFAARAVGQMPTRCGPCSRLINGVECAVELVAAAKALCALLLVRA